MLDVSHILMEEIKKKLIEVQNENQAMKASNQALVMGLRERMRNLEQYTRSSTWCGGEGDRRGRYTPDALVENRPGALRHRPVHGQEGQGAVDRRVPEEEESDSPRHQPALPSPTCVCQRPSLAGKQAIPLQTEAEGPITRLKVHLVPRQKILRQESGWSASEEDQLL
ncbi:hypothetical protein J6590_040860 [Homalodisca vitripennis]|nr:hypothetical protein J6590_040860 [Homalodisca vitripennis]